MKPLKRSFSRKIYLLSSVFVGPIIVLLSFLGVETHKSYQFTLLEIQGMQALDAVESYGQELRRVYEQLDAPHVSYSQAALSLTEKFEVFEALERERSKNSSASHEADREYFNSEIVSTYYSYFKFFTDLLESDLPREKVQELFRRFYDEIVPATHNLRNYLLNSSNLILDPDLDSYYLMHSYGVVLSEIEREIYLARIKNQKVSLGILENRLGALESSINLAIQEDKSFNLQRMRRSGLLLQGVSQLQSLVREMGERREGEQTTVSRENIFKPFMIELETLKKNIGLDLMTLLKARQESILARMYLLLGLSLLCCIGAAFVAMRISRDLIMKVNVLKFATKKISSGDFGSLIPLKRDDEFSELSGHFNDMAIKLQGLTDELLRKNQELTSINQNLERIVESRTEQIRTILDHVAFGFFLMDADLKVLPGYSKSCRTLIHPRFDHDQCITSFFGFALSTKAELLRTKIKDYFLNVGQESSVERMTTGPSAKGAELLPARLSVGARTLALTCSPVFERLSLDTNSEVSKPSVTVKAVLVSVIDVSYINELERENLRQKRAVSWMRQRSKFKPFLHEICDFLRDERQWFVASALDVDAIIDRLREFDLHELAKPMELFVRVLAEENVQERERLPKLLQCRDEMISIINKDLVDDLAMAGVVLFDHLSPASVTTELVKNGSARVKDILGALPELWKREASQMGYAGARWEFKGLDHPVPIAAKDLLLTLWSSAIQFALSQRAIKDSVEPRIRVFFTVNNENHCVQFSVSLSAQPVNVSRLCSASVNGGRSLSEAIFSANVRQRSLIALSELARTSKYASDFLEVLAECKRQMLDSGGFYEEDPVGLDLMSQNDSDGVFWMSLKVDPPMTEGPHSLNPVFSEARV